MDVGGFSLDQLMELAGLSVSQAGTQHFASITSIDMNYNESADINQQYIKSIHQVRARESWWFAGLETMVKESLIPAFDFSISSSSSIGTTNSDTI
jgi:hypothetical protein